MSDEGSRLATSPGLPRGRPATPRRAIELTTRSAEDTQRLGERLGACARAGDVVALWGELGAGKTVLAKGIARGLGTRDVATSPTFVIVNEYDGPLPMYHVDFYRLGPGDVARLGWEEYLGLGGVVVIEWPDRAPWLPEERLDVRLEHSGASERRVRFEPRGRRATELADAARS